MDKSIASTIEGLVKVHEHHVHERRPGAPKPSEPLMLGRAHR